MYRLAMLSMHGCPVARLGERDTGGMNVYVLQAAKELGRRGHKIDVYTRVHDPNDPQVIALGDNARVVHLNAGPYRETKGSLHRYIPQFLDSLYRFQGFEGISYDLVHSHYWLSGFAGIELGQKWGVPHAATFHTLARAKMEARAAERESPLRLATESEVMSRVDSMVVSTEQEKQDLHRLYGVPPHKVEVISAGVDLEMFSPVDRAEARRSLGLTEKRVILSVGRIEPLKGLDILIPAVAMLSDVSDIRLMIVGGEPGREPELHRLSSLAKEHGLQDMVTFTGAVRQAELPKYYSAADVFVMPSYYETFGLASLEAMACGTPVIAARVGGPRSFIEEGKSGFLVSWHCPEPYAERLELVLRRDELRERIGMAARDKARTMGWDTMVRAILKHYDALIGERWMNVAGA